MKFEQWIILLIAAIVVCHLGKLLFENYDEITFEYDPATGKQKMAARKNRMLPAPTPLTLEGE
jgi:hypothetical protein